MRKLKFAKRRVLGVTGSVASGKSSVARAFASYGAQVIDADKIAHEIINARSSAYKKILALFGDGILDRKKNIDRKKLGRLVFSDKRMLERLNSIMHPEIIRVIKYRMKKSKAKIIVLDAPLLIEAGLAGLVDKLVVVTSSIKAQLERAAKGGLARPDAYKRIHSQMPLKSKVSLADFVIDNGGSLEKTRKQVCKIRRMLWKN